MFDFRYHIASLVAIFLALAVGILLGTSIIDKGIMVNQQNKLISDIQQNISQVKAENSLLKKINKSQEEFEQLLLPGLVKDSLKGKTISLISFSGERKTASEITDLISSAGGKANAVFIDNRILTFGDKELNQLVKESKLVPVTGNFKTEDVLNKLAAEFISSDRPLIKLLSDNGYLEVTDEAVLPAQAAVFLPFSVTEEADTSIPQLQLAQKLSGLKVRAIVAEQTKSDPSVIKYARRLNLSSVDNIDMILGKLSLVYLLKGKSGHYGLKSTADKLTPLSK